MTDSETIAASEAIVSREIGGELVLLDLAGGFYFGLNAVGAAIWQRLEEGPATIAQLTEQVVQTFEVDAETARADIVDLVAKMKDQGLVVRGPGAA